MNCRQIRPIVLALALTLPLAAADPELIRLTRPDANFLLGARLSDIAASPLVKTLLDEALASKPEWGVALASGSNPLAGFDEVLISANIDTQSPQEPKDALVLLRGSLDLARLEKAFCSTGCDREQYRRPGDDQAGAPGRRHAWLPGAARCPVRGARRAARRAGGDRPPPQGGRRPRSIPRCRAGSTASGAITFGWPPRGRSTRRTVRQSPARLRWPPAPPRRWKVSGWASCSKATSRYRSSSSRPATRTPGNSSRRCRGCWRSAA